MGVGIKGWGGLGRGSFGSLAFASVRVPDDGVRPAGGVGHGQLAAVPGVVDGHVASDALEHLVRLLGDGDLQKHERRNNKNENKNKKWPGHAGRLRGGGERGRGGGAYSFFACLSHLTIDHTPLFFETEHRSYS